MKVTLYSTPTCPYCHQAARFLREKGVDFVEYDVSLDKSAANEMVRKSGQMGVPVITIDDQVIIGFDQPRLNQLLKGVKQNGTPSLGIRIIDVTKVAGSEDIHMHGAYVDRVTAGLPGERLGLRHGDIITSINHHAVRNSDELAEIISTLSRGSSVTVDFIRDSNPRRGETCL